MDTAGTAPYCAPNWYGMTLFVPRDSAQFPYYFAMVMAAQLKGKNLYVPNITGSATVSCDITKTGYGLAMMP